MVHWPDARVTRTDLVWCGVAVVISLVGAVLGLQLWHADLHVPFSYGGDGVVNQVLVKGVLDHGWYQHNPDLGAPFGLTLYDFPVVSGDNFSILLMKTIGLFSRDSALVENLFFLLTFPLCAVTAFVALRALELSPPTSAAMAGVFALLPAHFIQGETHVFIAAYYAVPLGALLAIRAADPAPIDLRVRRNLVLVVVACLIVGSAHVYYAAFAMTLLAAVALFRLAVRPRRTAVTALVFLTAIAVVAALNHLPNAIYQAQHGHNQALVRPDAEAEVYGLKIAQMVLPVQHHRIGALARLRARYDGNGTQVQEGDPQALGLIPTLGLIGLLVVGLATLTGVLRDRPPPRALSVAAALALVAILVGTVGGLSSVFSYLVTSQLRAWGRISVYIAFFGLIALGFGLDRFLRRRALHDGGAVLAAVLVIAFVDQTNASTAPDYSQTKAAYVSDARLVASIERLLPSDASVFELPYEPFPEPQPQWIPRIGPYDMGRPYLHSHDLRWSYGLMKGRAGDWQAAAMQLPPEMLARALAAAGFSGIYLNGDSYADNGRHVLDGLVRETRTKVIGSQDGRLFFLDLRAYAARLRAQHGQAQVATLRRHTLQPVTVRYGDGFSTLSQTLEGRIYKAGADAQIVVSNPGPGARELRLVMRVQPAYPAGADFEIAFRDRKPEAIRLSPGGTTLRRAISVPRGESQILLKTNGHPQLALPSDTQPYYLRVLDPLLIDRALTPFGSLPKDRRAAAWLEPFGTI